MDELRDVVGLGVAGNMTGHLEQAGEAADFVGITAPKEAPKGVFPWYVPGAEGALGVFPLSSDTLRLPADGAPVQLEPEVGLLCQLVWEGDRVVAVRPTAFAAFDDCSRRVTAPRISLKKSWGPGTKGLSATLLPVERLEDLDRWRLACFLVRDGETSAYGVDSAVGGYAYFHDVLLSWLVERIGAQIAQGPLEDIGAWLRVAGRPQRAVIGIGATRYTELGERTWVRDGDVAVVVVYDGERHSPEAVAAAIGRGEDPAGASVLRRAVVAS